MGSCLSSQSDFIGTTSSTAKIISINGDLHEYPIPITASQVLKTETHDVASVFICNSDKLYFDDFIPPMDSNELLEEGQIYFVLPVSKLQYPLSTSDMAALAVKASAALVDASSKKSSRWRRKGIQVSPLLEDNPSQKDGDLDGFKRIEKESSRYSRSGSVKKLQRNASFRAKVAYRSFRARLTTIYEGSIAE